jgi:hypothetical protein
VKTSRKLILLVLFACSASADPGAPKTTSYTTLAKGHLLDFRFSFPTIAGSYPGLLAQLRADQKKSYSNELAQAREEAEYRAEEKFPFNTHEFWRDWTTTGQTTRLIGLQCRTDTFEGGAHPNHTSAWLLWDKKRNATIGLKDLFVAKNGFWPVLERSYCLALKQERLRRSGTGSLCAGPNQLTIEFLDTNLDWSFDTVRIIADPYAAGTYAEGSYVVNLPMTANLIAAVKPEYRSSFEAQRQ